MSDCPAEHRRRSSETPPWPRRKARGRNLQQRTREAPLLPSFGLDRPKSVEDLRPLERAIGAEIERLIAVLDAIHGDPDLEAEIDYGADDVGEPS